MKNNLLFSFFFLLISNITYGQDWKKMYTQGKSFEEIKTTMAKKFQHKSTSKRDNNYSKEFKQYARWEYYWKHNLDATGNFVSPQQVLNSWQETQTLENNFQNTATSNWSFVGPNVIPSATAPTYAGLGRVNALTFDPSNTNIIWVGAPNGGLWKTINGGTSWESKGDNLPVLGISDIAISANGQTIYIASGDADGQHSVSVGILKSTDGGNTFNPTGFVNTVNDASTAQLQIHHLWIHPSNSDIVVATSTSGTHRTTNGGTNWTKVDNFSSSDIEMKSNDPNTLYVASVNSIIESTDGGATWSNPIFEGPNTIQKMEIAVTANDPNVIYIISDNGIGKKTINGGTSWIDYTVPNGYNTQGGYNMTLVVAPNDKDKIMLGGVSGWISTNGGASWTQQFNGVWQNNSSPGKYVHSDHHIMKFVPGNNNMLYVGHDGGVHKGDFFDINATWTDLSEGLFITQFYSMDGFPGDANKLIAGAQDNDGVFYNGTTWKNINNNSDGVGGRIDHSNSDISYMQSQQGYLTMTEDAWANSSDVNVSASDQGGFVWPLEMDPVTPTTLFAGFGNIHKTTNKGSSWTAITNESDLNNKYTSISVSPVDVNTIYAVRGETEIKVTTNGGTTWTTSTNPVSGGMIKQITASLTDAQKVYIVFSGYTTGEKVYVSTNGGGSWTNMSTGIPNIPVHCIAEKKTSGDLYIGTTLGVYSMAVGSNSWSSFNTNLPNVTVTYLDIHEATSMLRAATFGRGIYKTPLTTSDCEAHLTITANPASGDYNASETITTSGTVEVTGTATFKAGTSITLTNGFHAKTGSSFSAIIEGCTPASLTEDDIIALERSSDEGIKTILTKEPIHQGVVDLQIMPNPTNDVSTIFFELAAPTEISIYVYNSNGQLIDNLASSNYLDAGKHNFLFNGTYQQTGLYYLILRTDKELITKKIMIMR